MAGRNSFTNSTNESSQQTQETYSVDIRYFLIMLFTAMTVFFAIGFLTAPVPPSTWSTNLSDSLSSESQSSTINPVKRTQAKHSTEIGSKILNDDLNQHHEYFQEPSYEDLGQGEGVIRRPTASSPSINSSGDEQQEHLPAGQHLLVDIKNVSAKFLNSEERLAQAMVDTVKSAGLTLLSYHCHSLVPAGVSCVGVLLESHISFHTWPEEGVITLDLFTCGEKPLLPIVPELERLFGVPRSEDGQGEDEEIVTLWSHELRGFRDIDPIPKKSNYMRDSDFADWILSPLDLYMKKQIISTESEYHRIDIWDVVTNEDTPSYEDALKHNLTKGDPRWHTPELVSPERALFMNGVLQSTKSHDREYHESLVHPAMLAHPNPVHVAVIGGGEGSVVREFLKFKSVQSITMIEIDPVIVEISRKYLPTMNDCSDIVGVAENCFDDERLNLVIEDAATWFMDRYGEGATKESPVEKFDVIIIDIDDALDNQGNPVYGDEALKAILKALSDDGTFGSSLGEPHNIHDPRAEYSGARAREKYMRTLEADENIAAMFVYEEAHTGEDKPNAFMTACKNAKCRDLWFADAMVIDYTIGERVRETKSGDPILFHYDGGTQYLFQVPPRGWEEVYCRRDPVPFECDFRGLDPTKDLFEMDIEDEESSSFNIVYSDEEVIGIRATVDIPQGSYIMPSDVAASFTISEHTHNQLKTNVDIKDTGDVSVIENFLSFIEDHGHKTVSYGSSLKYVEVGATSMIRESENLAEVNIGRWMPTHPDGVQPVFSPVYDRHMVSYDVFLVTTKDIKEGDELVKPVNLWTE